MSFSGAEPTRTSLSGSGKRSTRRSKRATSCSSIFRDRGRSSDHYLPISPSCPPYGSPVTSARHTANRRSHGPDRNERRRRRETANLRLEPWRESLPALGITRAQPYFSFDSHQRTRLECANGRGMSTPLLASRALRSRRGPAPVRRQHALCLGRLSIRPDRGISSTTPPFRDAAESTEHQQRCLAARLHLIVDTQRKTPRFS